MPRSHRQPPITAPGAALDYAYQPAPAAAKGNAKVVVKEIALEVVRHHVPQPANNSVQALVDRLVPVGVDKPVEEAVTVYVKTNVTDSAIMIVPSHVQGNALMAVLVLAEELVAMHVEVVVMEQLDFSNG